MRRLRLYSRPGCHLCETVAVELAPIVSGRASVEVIDISADPALEARYLLRIPILADGELELSGYPLDRDAVERHLAQYADGSRRL